jgi:hypothetical protein
MGLRELLAHWVHALYDVISHAFAAGDIHAPLPAGLQETVSRLRRARSRHECLRQAYAVLAEKYQGHSLETYTRLFDLFRHDPDSLWRRRGFIHCTGMNYLMRILLVKSGWFAEEDILRRWTLVWYLSPHQYLRVRLAPGSFMDIDIWGKAYGIALGDHAHGFHARAPPVAGRHRS